MTLAERFTQFHDLTLRQVTVSNAFCPIGQWPFADQFFRGLPLGLASLCSSA
jgi:hypothetical protein